MTVRSEMLGGDSSIVGNSSCWKEKREKENRREEERRGKEEAGKK
jgi:hypothetical protein